MYSVHTVTEPEQKEKEVQKHVPHVMVQEV